jgi:hypothetical protein
LIDVIPGLVPGIHRSADALCIGRAQRFSTELADGWILGIKPGMTTSLFLAGVAR